ncbi:MAG: GTP cyclohydrolase II [Castellaniella sp.]|uniref:GTP cyclohydrolase II n=1 Tax=Castellaniella sp. TaxID=1955812 RepID=UPI00121C9E16|nr:GTP cyclohydrolase II [Castellaniella sp.]TAN30312.1 MAG: GTP cyclohydrolase II [Castellaniella sp.]
MPVLTGASADPDTDILRFVASSQLPTPWAVFQIHAFAETVSGKEHVALTLGDVGTDEPVLARIHSECLTGDALFSQRCDCGAQLEAALQRIATEGRGILLYLRQEGRGIGLLNKIRAYHLQDEGADTVEANERLGFPADLRHYDICRPMLAHFGIRRVRLMTNNPRKERFLNEIGVSVVEHIPLQVNRNPYNEFYLRTKARKLGHEFKEYFGEAP